MAAPAPAASSIQAAVRGDEAETFEEAESGCGCNDTDDGSAFSMARLAGEVREESGFGCCDCDGEGVGVGRLNCRDKRINSWHLLCEASSTSSVLSEASCILFSCPPHSNAVTEEEEEEDWLIMRVVTAVSLWRDPRKSLPAASPG